MKSFQHQKFTLIVFILKFMLFFAQQGEANDGLELTEFQNME